MVFQEAGAAAGFSFFRAAGFAFGMAAPAVLP
jgi:hypothetical protein